MLICLFTVTYKHKYVKTLVLKYLFYGPTYVTGQLLMNGNNDTEFHNCQHSTKYKGTHQHPHTSTHTHADTDELILI